MTTETSVILYMLTLHQVMQRTGLSRSAIYYRLNPASPYYDPTFPRQIRLGRGSNSVRFSSVELDIWIEQCIAASR
ncbi:helix-turn-helix transcriptional regulator [Pseudomonas aeruginosa]